ncbi:MAG TPA: FecR domain-containing protein [Bacteroidota bacterium]|nr:FecR domain-containing protein [Bacteroidota bacterium]
MTDRRAIKYGFGTLAAAALIFSMTATGFRSPGATLALITKVIREVSMKNETSDWDAAEKGDILKTGDRVKTGQQSLAILKFNDRSIVRVREKSEITMTTEADGKGTVKSLNSSEGAFGFDIQKQRADEKFRFTSPTSVASIRGTSGTWGSGLGNDTLVLPTGLVNLLNKISDRNIDVPAGYIAFSNADGSLSMRPATEEELAAARRLATGGTPRELDLKLRNGNGDEKDLIIKYRN